MYIIPYYIREQYKGRIFWVFLSQGGKKGWKTDETGTLTNKFIETNYLIPNGFVGKSICVKGDCLYFRVDPGAMNMGDFYTWTEFLKAGKPIPSDIDIWRPFVWVDDDGWSKEAESASIPFSWDGLSSH
jgi:hypothetical protein